MKKPIVIILAILLVIGMLILMDIMLPGFNWMSDLFNHFKGGGNTPPFRTM